MKTYTQDELVDSLKQVGLTKGDIVYIHSCLFSLGLMRGASNKEELCSKILDSFLEVVGDEGTLVVPTFTTQTARYGTPFVLESTECMTGIFAEYVRRHPDSIRSLHPINSVAAIGKQKYEICEDCALSNYGIDSPFDRMLNLKAKAVNLGLKHFSNSWHHYLEAMYLVPYVYNKLLDIEVFKDGRKVNKPFSASLRFLDYEIVNDMSKFDDLLLKRGLINIASVGESVVGCISVDVYCRVGLEMLKKDPYSFLKHPPRFRHGEIPFDGISKGRDTHSLRKAYLFLAEKNK